MNSKNRNSSLHVCRLSNAVGASLLELALVLPIIIMLLAAGIEYSRSMATYSQMNSLIREITGNAFRECAKKAGSSATSYMTDTDACLQSVLAASNSTAVRILPGASIIVSAFRWEGDAITGNPRFVTSQANSSGGPSSKLSVGDFTADPRRKLLTLHKVLVYGEIYYTYQPIIPLIAGIFGYGGNRSFYVAAAF